MKELVISPDANADLTDIYDYTSDTWGMMQADRYLDEMNERIVGLVTGRTASRPAFELQPSLRRALAGSHVVFFREDAAAAVTVVRVLHQRMDVRRG